MGTRKILSLNTAQPAGSQFPDPIKAEVQALIAANDGLLVNPMYLDPSRVELPAPRLLCTDTSAPTTGKIQMVLFTPRVDFTVDALLTTAWASSTQAAASACRLGIFRAATLDEEITPLTCVARSAHNASRWNGEGTKVATIADNGAASPTNISEVTVEAGERYGAALITVGHTGSPNLQAIGSYRPLTEGPPVGFSIDGQTTLPASIPSGGWVEEWTLPWIGLRVVED